jgi:magnesium transporter
MRSWIDHSGEVVWEPAPSLVAQLIEAGQPFWLDIENPTDETIDQLASRLGLHPLAVEDSKQFGQRAKLQVYGNGVMLVGFGLARRAPPLMPCARQARSSRSLEATRSGRCTR